jgi:hypothetical protein
MSGNESDSRALARLFGVGPESPWDRSDLSALLDHEIDVPFEQLRRGHDQPNVAPRTLRELVGTEHPSHDLLVALKDHYKAGVDGSGPLPADLCRLLYLLCGRLAETRLGRPISRLDSAAREQGERWALAQTWVPAWLRSELRSD